MQMFWGRLRCGGRAFRTTALLAALATALVVLRAGVARARPNIVFIMSDDHCSQAIGAYGGRLAKLDPTPVIDTLARDGMLFENCFVTNSICTPSRACIITGQYNHVNGVHTLGGRIPPERQYLAIEMRKAGYQTAMIGKWHLKEEPNFDYYKVLPGQGKYHDPSFREKTAGRWPRNEVKMKGHSSDCITDTVLEWMKRRDRDRPFFLMYHFKAPHDMFENAKRYDSYLADVAIPEPESLWRQPDFGSIATRGHDDELVRFIGTSIGRRHARRNYTRNWAKDASLTDDEAKRTAYLGYLRRYLRCVKGVDDNLKRFFDYLRSEGVYDDTVIVYTGDQGFMLGEHDYQDKRWMYDESQRMPFIVRYPPTVRAGSRTDAIIENVDFAPMMLDFAGVPTPEVMQGRSFRPILETGREPDDWKQAAYYRYWMHMAIRTKTHKLIYYYGCDMKGGKRTPPGWELYNLKDDPKEVRNIYDDPAHIGTVVKLKRELAELRRNIGDTDTEFPGVKKIIEEFWEYDDEARRKAVEISHQCAAENAKPRSRSGSASGRGPKPMAGGWFAPAKSSVPLREHRGCREVSRDAVYRVSHPGNSGFNLDNAYLLSGDAPSRKPHAFHSADNAEGPHVVIRLAEERAVRYVKIRNRTGSHQERAEGLTVWVSSDGKSWREVWRAARVEQEWTVDAGGAGCRYLKIGLPGRGTLHLNKVTVFGE